MLPFFSWLYLTHQQEHWLPIKKRQPNLFNSEISMRLADYVSHKFINFFMDESGAPLIEYALIASLIAVVCGLFLLALIKDI